VFADGRVLCLLCVAYDPVTAGYLSPDPLGPDPWPELTGHIGMTAGIADWFSSRDST
jgi:hypothetical protein